MLSVLGSTLVGWVRSVSGIHEVWVRPSVLVGVLFCLRVLFVAFCVLVGGFCGVGGRLCLFGSYAGGGCSGELLLCCAVGLVQVCPGGWGVQKGG